MEQEFIPQLFQGKKYEIEITDRAATIRMRDGGKLVIPDQIFIYIDEIQLSAGIAKADVKFTCRDGRRGEIRLSPPEKIIGSLRLYRLASTDEAPSDEANQ